MHYIPLCLEDRYWILSQVAPLTIMIQVYSEVFTLITIFHLQILNGIKLQEICLKQHHFIMLMNKSLTQRVKEAITKIKSFKINLQMTHYIIGLQINLINKKDPDCSHEWPGFIYSLIQTSGEQYPQYIALSTTFCFVRISNPPCSIQNTSAFFAFGISYKTSRRTLLLDSTSTLESK